MPEWAEKLVLQFPIVALIGVAVWLALRYTDRRYDRFLEREQKLREQEKAAADAFRLAVEGLEATFRAAVAELDKQSREALSQERAAFETRVKALNAEIRRLRRQLRRPGGPGGTA